MMKVCCNELCEEYGFECVNKIEVKSKQTKIVRTKLEFKLNGNNYILVYLNKSIHEVYCKGSQVPDHNIWTHGAALRLGDKELSKLRESNDVL